MYQCRGDLSHLDCNKCVETLQHAITTICNPKTFAARAHLTACYMFYQAVNFPQAPDTDVLYKKCGSVRVGGSDLGGSGFGEKMEVVFGMVVKGVGVRGGYYAGWYEGVYALGQCQSDLGESECVNCLRNASLVAKGECSDLGSVSADVYLEKCWLTYSYYPGGADNSNRGSHSGGLKNKIEKFAALGLSRIVILLLAVSCVFVVVKSFFG